MRGPSPRITNSWKSMEHFLTTCGASSAAIHGLSEQELAVHDNLPFPRRRAVRLARAVANPRGHSAYPNRGSRKETVERVDAGADIRRRFVRVDDSATGRGREVCVGCAGGQSG